MRVCGEEETAAKRLLERVFSLYGRFFDAVLGDALYFDAPLINFCIDHGKHVIITLRGHERLLLQDARRLFAQRVPGQWKQGNQHVQFWDEEGFTSCEGVKQPLRVLGTVETTTCRQRVGGQWRTTEKTACWYWATTFSKRQLSPLAFWRAAHGRWDIENDCFNTLAKHWGLDHCYKHDPTAIVNFTLTLLIVFVLLQCFWLRNLKPPLRARLTLIALARELDRSLAGCVAPWRRQLPRGP